MAPKELPSFFLYSHGISPKILTLGTLVYGNYGIPETQSVTFPMSKDHFETLQKQDQIISDPVSGCFTFSKHSKYGLGIGVAEVAELEFEYVKNCQKVVLAEEGRRVTLRDTDAFFEEVLAQQKLRDKLTVWLTAAKSAWLFHKVTFQKPRVFCCTGFYELSKGGARISEEHALVAKVGVSPAVVAATSEIPVGGTIGPFRGGESLGLNVKITTAGIWAARFHQLKVKYLQIATEGTTELPPHIKLRIDCTHPRGGLMGDEGPIKETKVVVEEDEIKSAKGTLTEWGEAEEIGDDDDLSKGYWEAFNEAVSRLEDDEDDAVIERT